MADMYVGAFAYETAAVACIKGFDLTKFENVKYFPIDMAYYHEGSNKTKRVRKITNLHMMNYLKQPVEEKKKT